MLTWESAIKDILRKSPHVEMKYYFDEIEELPSYFNKRLATPAGQLNDFGLALKDGKGIHIKEYEDHYTIHWDKIDPSVSTLGHLYEDAPEWLALLGLTGIIVGVGLYKYFKKDNDNL